MAMIPLLVQLSGGRLCRLPDPDTSRDRFLDHSADEISCATRAQLDAAGGVPGRAGVDRALIVSDPQFSRWFAHAYAGVDDRD
jgi:hypothetical protein